MEILTENPNPSKMDGHRKKILFVITKSFWGGAQVYVYDLATSLAEEGFDVAVVLGGEGRLKTKLEEENIRVITLSNLARDISIIDEFKVFFDLIKIFKKEQPDIVHLNSSKIGGLGSLAGRLARVKKIVFTAHGWAFNEDRSWMQRAIIKFLSWLTIILSHRTITIAKKEREQVINYPFVSKKISTIYNAIPSADFIQRDESRKNLLPSLKNDFIWIGTIAELHKNKGLKYAIEAVDILKKNDINVNFVVISEGEERETLEKIIKEKDLSDRVFLVGVRDKAVTLLKAFDIFLLPSVKEGFPYTLLEAGLAELPVIATNVGGIPEIIEDHVTGMIVRPKNPKEIYLAIRYLIENRDKKESFGKNLNKRVRKDFELSRMVGETKELYLG